MLFIFFLWILIVLIIYDYFHTTNDLVCKPTNKPKLLFLHNSNNELYSNFITNIYSPIKSKYEKNKNIELISIDISNDNKYLDNSNYLPQIYFLDYDTNTILLFPNNTQLNYVNLDNFITNSYSTINK